MLNARANPYTAVYQVLEAISSSSTAAIPAGALGTIFTAVYLLRDLQVESSDIAVAERISVVIHKLRRAHQAGEAGDIELYWNEVCYLADEWRSRPISLH